MSAQAARALETPFLASELQPRSLLAAAELTDLLLPQKLQSCRWKYSEDSH